MTAPSLPTPATTAGRARIVELLSLADELPEVDELEEFLTDDDPAVRRAALAVLGENLPPGVELAMAAALGDADEGVRTAAYDGLRELREVIEPGPAFADGLSRHQASPHAATRAAVVRLQWEHRLGDLDGYRTALHDADPVVRREAVAGLVSLDATGALAASAADLDALVRLAVAQGLASVGDPAGSATLDLLAGDQDLRVRAAAIEGYGTLGCGPVSLAAVLAAIDDPAWEMRKASGDRPAHRSRGHRRPGVAAPGPRRPHGRPPGRDPGARRLGHARRGPPCARAGHRRPRRRRSRLCPPRPRLRTPARRSPPAPALARPLGRPPGRTVAPGRRAE